MLDGRCSISTTIKVGEKAVPLPLSNYLNLSDEVTEEELNLITRHFLYTSTNDEIIHKGLDIQFADEVTANKIEEESVAFTKNIVNRYLAITKTVA